MPCGFTADGPAGRPADRRPAPRATRSCCARRAPTRRPIPSQPSPSDRDAMVLADALGRRRRWGCSRCAQARAPLLAARRLGQVQARRRRLGRSRRAVRPHAASIARCPGIAYRGQADGGRAPGERQPPATRPGPRRRSGPARRRPSTASADARASAATGPHEPIAGEHAAAQPAPDVLAQAQEPRRVRQHRPGARRARRAARTPASGTPVEGAGAGAGRCPQRPGSAGRTSSRTRRETLQRMRLPPPRAADPIGFVHTGSGVSIARNEGRSPLVRDAQRAVLTGGAPGQRRVGSVGSGPSTRW